MITQYIFSNFSPRKFNFSPVSNYFNNYCFHSAIYKSKIIQPAKNHKTHASFQCLIISLILKKKIEK